MSLHVYCNDANGDVVELGAIRLGTVGLVTAAEQGTMAQATIDIPDKGGVLRLAGLKRIWAQEPDSPVGSRTIWTGYLGDRTIHRGDGELLIGSDRVITANVFDLNELLNDVIVKGDADATHGVRPAETDLERVAWLLQATPSWFPTVLGVAAVHDLGFVATTGGVAMDACDYRGQTPQAVLQDCADKSGRNWFVYFDEAEATPYGLWYDTPDSPNFVCTLAFSNVDGDADYDTIWPMNPAGPVEVQDPGKIVSGVRAVYTGGEVFRHASDIGLTTATDFYLREQTAPSANTKSPAVASAMADRLLRDNDEEEVSASFSVLLPSTHVGLVRAGMRVSCRFEHFDPPYREWTDWRILRLETLQDQPNPGWYDLKLDVTPLPPLIGVQGAFYHGTTATPLLPHATTEGNLLVAMIFAVDGRAGYATVDEPVLTDKGGSSTNPWTVGAAWTQGYAPTQYGGPGTATGVGIWWRRVTATEVDADEPLEVTVNGIDKCGVHLWEIGTPVDPGASLTYTNSPAGVASGGTVTVGAALSGFILGGMTAQATDYGDNPDIAVVHGTVLSNTDGYNVDAVVYPTEDWLTPRIWIATDTDGGPLSATVSCYWSQPIGVAGVAIELPGITSLPAIPYPANQVG